eukprot:scaffold112548_cov33-Attheya_sp.AAC.1
MFFSADTSCVQRSDWLFPTEGEEVKVGEEHARVIGCPNIFSWNVGLPIFYGRLSYNLYRAISTKNVCSRPSSRQLSERIARIFHCLRRIAIQ